MKVFTTNDFTGHWPAGTAAVVIAESRAKAVLLMIKKLEEEGLMESHPTRRSTEQSFTLIEIDLTGEQAIMLSDGGY